MTIDWPMWFSLPMVLVGVYAAVVVTYRQEKEYENRCATRMRTRRQSDKSAKD